MNELDRRISVAPMMDWVNSWRFTFVAQLLSNPTKLHVANLWPR